MYALDILSLLNKGKAGKEALAGLPAPERILVMQAKIAADNLRQFLDLVEKEGRLRSQQEEADLRKAAGGIVMLSEALAARKGTQREEAITHVAAVIDRYVASIGFGFALGGLAFVGAGVAIGVAVGQFQSGAFEKISLGVCAIGGASAGLTFVPKISRHLLLAKCVREADRFV